MTSAPLFLCGKEGLQDISFESTSLCRFLFKSFYIFFHFTPGRISERSVLMPRQALPEEVLQYDDFLGWTVSSLKDFLSLRGLKQTGRKSELVARAFGAYELNAPVKFTQEQIYQQIKEEYARRLRSNGIKSDPNNIPHGAWIDDVKQWPETDDGKLFSYILRTKAVDVDYIEKYKDQKAYSYWMSSFVDTVLFTKCPVDSKHVFLKGCVSPSQKNP